MSAQRDNLRGAALVQRLKRLICLGTGCHTATHYGYVQVRGLESKPSSA
ncbi:hypothetical protein OG244_07055 [Streptomyces brevispora]|nr:hypothetical protein [Streptomyces brevispora]